MAVRHIESSPYYRHTATRHEFANMTAVKDGFMVACTCGDGFVVEDRRDIELAMVALDDHAAAEAKVRADAEWALSVKMHNVAMAELRPTEHARWMTAAKAIRRRGIAFRTNVQKCCRGCITSDDLGLKAGHGYTADNAPVAYTFGGQGGRIVWDERGRATRQRPRSRYYYGRDDDDGYGVAYVNHSDGILDEGMVAAIVVEEFRNAGLDARWDGNTFSCVEVHFGTTTDIVPTGGE